MDRETDVIYNPSTDAYFNLAAEQYLLDRDDPRPVFMLWRNANTVVIGRNQNAYAEINEPFTRANGIKVVRRLTGGGAVFHDEGNVNYTFIVPESEGKALDFAYFCKPVVDALQKLGADAGLSGRNDIVIGGRKVSGNAQCVRNGRIMHHGTLLWSADLSRLAGALNVDPEKIASKGIKSVRSRVENIRDILNSEMNVTQFIDYLFSALGRTPRALSDGEISSISALRETRYATWEWNWGKSKAFSAERKKYFPFGLVEISFDAKEGVLEDVSISGDFFGVRGTSELCASLRGAKLIQAELEGRLANVDRYISGADAAAIASLILDPV